jgi:hypothetical protein
MREYKTIAELSFNALDAGVNEYLRNGWRLWGSPYIAGEYFVQAVFSDSALTCLRRALDRRRRCS